MRIPNGYTVDEAKWVAMKWREIRNSQILADEANGKWKRVNAEINEWLSSHQIEDIVQRAKIKGESLALQDALSTGKWHSQNAMRHIADVELFIKMKEKGLL